MCYPNMSFKWMPETVEKLILYVEQNPCLYHVKSVDYLDRVKKAQAFNNIFIELSKEVSNLTVEEVKRKWRILRNQYMREQRQIQNSKKSGAGTMDIYVPKLWCFERLGFLQSHTNMRAATDNTDVENDENAISGSIEEMCFADEHSRKRVAASSGEILNEVPQKKRKNNAVSELRNGLENVKSILVNNKREPMKFSWLGNVVAAQMENVHPEDQQDAAWEVQCLMRKLITKSRERHTSSSSSKDILELSMEGLFDDDEF